MGEAMTIAPLIAALHAHAIRLGDDGEAVRALQLAFAALGYKLRGTGYFGGATDTAVEDFQRKQMLQVDGVVGLMTARSIDAMIAALGATRIEPVVAHPGADRPLWLIEALSRVGIHEGVGAIDNPVIVEWAHEIGGEIGKNYTHDSIPWCALFIDSCLHRVGLKSTGTLWALD